jgi:hypothetical protein
MPSSRTKQTRKKDEEEYARRFLSVRKVKDYTPVYIDVRMKEKLQTLVSSLQHIVPEITPTILLSNILAETDDKEEKEEFVKIISKNRNARLPARLITTKNKKYGNCMY